MRDNYDLLKNLDIEGLDEEASKMEASYIPSGNSVYQEDIAPGIAKRILGDDRYIDKPGVRWQLITELDTMTLTAWVPGESEPTTFELDSPEEVVSYDDMSKQLANPDAYRMDLVTEVKSAKQFNWIGLSIAIILLLMFVGFGIMMFLFNLK